MFIWPSLLLSDLTCFSAQQADGSGWRGGGAVGGVKAGWNRRMPVGGGVGVKAGVEQADVSSVVS